jgi:hypothetical protein
MNILKLIFEAVIVAVSFLIVVVVFNNVLPNTNQYLVLGLVTAALHILFELTGSKKRVCSSTLSEKEIP